MQDVVNIFRSPLTAADNDNVLLTILQDQHPCLVYEPSPPVFGILYSIIGLATNCMACVPLRSVTDKSKVHADGLRKVHVERLRKIQTDRLPTCVPIINLKTNSRRANEFSACWPMLCFQTDSRNSFLQLFLHQLFLYQLTHSKTVVGGWKRAPTVPSSDPVTTIDADFVHAHAYLRWDGSPHSDH
jgi:hypothetical protein